jgi:hypothetical protein
MIWLRTGRGGGLLLKAVTNIRVPWNGQNLWLAQEPSASKGRIYCMGLVT